MKLPEAAMLVDFRLLTFNTLFTGHVHRLLAALAQLLNESAWDVVCLQEVLTRCSLAVLRDGLRGPWHVSF